MESIRITRVGADGAYVRCGIATAMLEELIAWGCEACWVGTEPENNAARAL